MPTNEQHTKFIDLIRDLAIQDKELREKYQVGDKFRFVRDQLNTLLSQLEIEDTTEKNNEIKQNTGLAEDEVVVYVYLYNSQGLLVRNWTSMLIPKVFYEYSVNRPIYSEKSHIQALIRAKANKQQHGFLSVIVKRTDILPLNPDAGVRDIIGNPVLKVKEGSLQFKRLISFTHNDIDYTVTEEGEIIKKNN